HRAGVPWARPRSRETDRLRGSPKVATLASMLDPADIEEHTQALIGQVLGGRYRLDAVLGIGAMGAVYRAYHTGLERAVALKLLHKDLMSSDEMRARFSREAAA